MAFGQIYPGITWSLGKIDVDEYYRLNDDDSSSIDIYDKYTTARTRVSGCGSRMFSRWKEEEEGEENLAVLKIAGQSFWYMRRRYEPDARRSP